MTYWRTFSTTGTIHRLNHATRYDAVHAGYGYLQLHHQAPTSSLFWTNSTNTLMDLASRDHRRGAAFGTAKACRPNFTELVEAYLDRLAILDWTNEVTSHYVRIRSDLKRSGTPIGNMDLLIAAHAVSHGMTVITNNFKHVSRVPGLKVEVWG